MIISLLNTFYSRPELKVTVIEKESEVCMHTSGRNTGVLHTGVYQGMGDLEKTAMIKRGYS